MERQGREPPEVGGSGGEMARGPGGQEGTGEKDWDRPGGWAVRRPVDRTVRQPVDRPFFGRFRQPVDWIFGGAGLGRGGIFIPAGGRENFWGALFSRHLFTAAAVSRPVDRVGDLEVVENRPVSTS